MEILKYGGITLLILGFLIVFVCSIKTGKPLKALMLNAFFGIAVLALINLTAPLTGVHIPLNWWSVGGSAAFGVPAVCGFLILPIIF